MAAAKGAQVGHWTSIIKGDFTETYAANVRRIGMAHARIGLEPSRYIGGYAIVLDRLIRGVLRATSKGLFGRRKAAGRQADVVSAVVRAAMLDMDFAIAVYIEAGRRDRHSLLQRLAGDFEKTIGGVVNIVASAATELQAAAKTMTSSASNAAEQSLAVDAASKDASSNVQSVAAATEQPWLARRSAMAKPLP